MCLGCTAWGRFWWTLTFGVISIAISIFVGVWWPSFSKNLVENELKLLEYTTNYQNWIRSPFPLYLEVYMFNWTNFDQVAQHETIKPHFEEVGPYVFEEYHERVGVEFLEDNEYVAFNQTKTWKFRPDLSVGSTSDRIFNLNPITASLSYWARLIPDEYKAPLLSILNLVIEQQSSLISDATVNEWLFDGYKEGLLNWIDEFVREEVPPEFEFLLDLVPFDRFAWFYERNASAAYDGRFVMNTGNSDINKLGVLKSWNGKDEVAGLRGECAKVQGTTGELWPPFPIKDTPDATLFVTDFCRTLTLRHEGEFNKFNLKGRKWVGDDRVFDNGDKYEEAACWCGAKNETECPDVKPGVYNASRCSFGAPAFASFPHFYLADPSYLVNLTGLEPNQEKHETYLALEPTAGIPLEVRARIQINLLMRNEPLMVFFNDVPDLFVPMFWFTQVADLPEDLAKEAKLLFVIQDAGMWVSGIFGGIGGVLILLSIWFYILARKKKD